MSPDLGLRRSAECPTEWMHTVVREMVEAVIRAHGCSPNMACCAALTTLAACIQGKSRAVVDGQGYSVPLTLWWLCVAPPAGGKSTVMGEFAGPLLRNQHRIQDEWEQSEARRRAKVKLETNEARKLGTLPHPDEHQQARLRKMLIDIELTRPRPMPWWTLTDINPSNYAKLLEDQVHARGVAAIAALDTEDEFLSNYLGRHQQHVQSGPLNHAYEGEGFAQSRSSRVNDGLCARRLLSSHATLGLILQSHWLERLEANTQLSESGFLSRCIITTSDRFRPPPNACPVPDAVRRSWDTLVCRLMTDILPEVVTLDPEEQSALGKMWQRTIASESPRAGEVRAAAKVARMLGLMHVVASIADAADDDDVTDGAGAGAGTGVEGVARARIVEDLLLFITANTSEDLGEIEKPALQPNEGPARTLATLRTSSAAAVMSARCGGVVALRDIRRALTTRTFRPSDSQVQAWMVTVCGWGFAEQVEITAKDRRCRSIRYQLTLEDGCMPGHEQAIRSLPAAAALPAEASAAISDAEWHAMAEKHRLLFQSAPGIKKPGSDPDPEDDGR